MHSGCLRLAPLLVLFIAGCANLAPRPEIPATHAVPEGNSTLLDQLIGEAESRHAGASGFRLIPEGPEAFTIRAHGAERAGRSIDVQTYIWHDDGTGAFLAWELLQAADRGVQVRLLVDDMDARGKTFSFAALDAHPNIEVRMFNPFASRTGSVKFAFEAMSSFSRINRRMHNKSWIVDNRLAVVGGRNLGDEYFGASDETNFVDLDFALAGPIVRDVSASFDRYWNSESAYPIALLAAEQVTAENLATLRTRLGPLVEAGRESRFAKELKANDALHRLVSGDWPLQWSSRYRFVADDPGKALGKQTGLGGSEVLELMNQMIKAAARDLAIISPYFVPGDAGTKALVARDSAGIDVQVLTNSLAANDVAAVYGGYSSYREDLLSGGVQIWELKPLPGSKVESSLFGSEGASLHTKALVSDDSTVFVGSFNLDPRSTSLNCEQGVFVEDAELSHQLMALFKEQTSGAHAWKVTLEGKDLAWDDGSGKLDSAPQASMGKRFQAWLTRVLPMDSQL